MLRCKFRTLLKLYKYKIRVIFAILVFSASAYFIQHKVKLYLYAEKTRTDYRNFLARNNKTKTILYWNTFFGIPDFMFGFGQTPFMKSKCEVNNCFITDYRLLLPLEKFDAILFHPYNMRFWDLPKKRNPRQTYVLFNMESPETIQFVDLKRLRNFFNWTATYRYDSDIHVFYGRVADASSTKQKLVMQQKQWRNRNGNIVNVSVSVKKKRKLIAWFVSDCETQSKREYIVRQMQKFVSVDIYGKCGPLDCSKTTKEVCYEMLSREYKFYLSFENSLCPDYVTEKFFNILKYSNVVPVVYGSANYSIIAPPHSYINVRDFQSIEKLVNYLYHLDQSDFLYQEYFWWKNMYEVRFGRIEAFCELCKLLHDETVPVKVYEDIDGWWNGKGKCESPEEVFQKLHAFN